MSLVIVLIIGFFALSTISSIFVVAASMLSSRISQMEEAMIQLAATEGNMKVYTWTGEEEQNRSFVPALQTA